MEKVYVILEQEHTYTEIVGNLYRVKEQAIKVCEEYNEIHNNFLVNKGYKPRENNLYVVQELFIND